MTRCHDCGRTVEDRDIRRDDRVVGKLQGYLGGQESVSVNQVAKVDLCPACYQSVTNRPPPDPQDVYWRQARWCAVILMVVGVLAFLYYEVFSKH